MSDFRSGFACFVGRPNAGKSTLTNAIVGEKIAITSSRPQTTRRVIRGILNRPDAQLILVDTPGLHRPRTLLGQRLNALVYETWSEVDVIGVCLPADQRIGPGDEFLIRQITELPDPPKLVALATKIDLVKPTRLVEHLAMIGSLEERLGVRWESVVPVSAVSGEQVETVVEEIVKLLPPGPEWYPDGETTDEPIEVRVGELIRESLLESVVEEVPHSIAIEIDEIRPKEDADPDNPVTEVFASIVLERTSQKGIIIGHRGSRLGKVRRNSKRKIKKLLGTVVDLNLHVRVLPDWQRDTKYLNRLGF